MSELKSKWEATWELSVKYRARKRPEVWLGPAKIAGAESWRTFAKAHDATDLRLALEKLRELQ